MHLTIHHDTLYRYGEAANRVFQALRLWPIPGGGQVIRDWRVEIDGRKVRPTCRDGFGNPAATHVIDGPVAALSIVVHAEIDTQDRQGVLGDAVESLPSENTRLPAAEVPSRTRKICTPSRNSSSPTARRSPPLR